jgi:hypothetical protein
VISDSQLMVIDMTTRRRIADLHAEAERYRLECLAQTPTDRDQRWTGIAVVLLVLSLALLMVATLSIGTA